MPGYFYNRSSGDRKVSPDGDRRYAHEQVRFHLSARLKISTALYVYIKRGSSVLHIDSGVDTEKEKGYG